jgi:predicted metal-dependent phosphoesterase TrpH
MRVDMHSHSEWSFDCQTTLAEILDALPGSGVDVLALTDHNEIDGALELKARAPGRIIVGEEVMTAEGEIIGLFLRELVPQGLTPEETIQAIHAQGGLAYVPHPKDRVRASSTIEPKALARVLGLVDALEGYNSKCLFPRFNSQARALARQSGLPMGGGSDAHQAAAIGRGWVEVDDFEVDDARGFLTALASGRIGGHGASLGGRLAPSAAKVRRVVDAWREREADDDRSTEDRAATGDDTPPRAR